MGGFTITRDPVDVGALANSLAEPRAGALVTFEGWVRNKNDGLPVTGLEYEIFETLAVSEGEKILTEAIAKFGLTGATAVHRDGFLKIGECAVWIGVTAPHRGDAFDACRYVIDEIKLRLPVWKKEHYVDAAPVWVNCQHRPHHETADVALRGVAREELYARQTILPEIGSGGQAKLAIARVLIVGAGGLGCAAAMALAGAGVGHLTIVDHDTVQASNLHRQMLFTANDIGKPKVAVAAARLTAMNPFISIDAWQARFAPESATALVSAHDIVLDCTDNFRTKYLLNDAAVLARVPLVQASLYRFEGQLLTVDGETAEGCLRCLWPEPPAAGLIGDCREAGVLGTVPLVFGALQANEAIKRIAGAERASGLFVLDLLSLEGRRIGRRRDPACAVCGAQPTISDLGQMDSPIDYVMDDSMSLRDAARTRPVVDVREGWEGQVRPVAHTHHIPFTAFTATPLDGVAKDAPILVVCAHGKRSEAAALALRKAGFKNAQSLAGGVEAFPPARTAV